MNININNGGYILCRSKFYLANDLLYESEYTITSGINNLVGEIDSGVWAISYLLSMYKYNTKDFVLFKDPIITVDGTKTSLSEFSKYSCYLDTIYPLFNSKASLRKLIMKQIKLNKSRDTADNIREIFCIDKERFERPLTSMGNEIYRAMASLGYTCGKEVFCFPWLSYKRYCGYHEQIKGLINILENLDKTIILPIGNNL